MPVAAYTEFYWTINARSLMNFVSLRAAETEQRGAATTREEGDGRADLRRARERRRELGRRSRGDEEVVGAAQALALAGRHVLADEVVEVGRPGHSSSPSSRFASRPRPLRVRVFTVPSGTFRNSATSLWDMPPQYASSITVRSFCGSSSSARCTRHATNEDSARSAGPGSDEASSGTSAGGSVRARNRSTIACRATA